MKIHVRRQTAVFAVMAMVFMAAAQAQKTPGISNNQILIGSCSALDGPARFLGLQTIVGATTYLNHVNSQGGVFGRKIQLLAFDDGYEPANAENCFKRLQKEGIFSAGFFVGTPTAAKYVPLAEANKVPVVGLFTGAEMLYTPLKHYVMNVRASYYDETREQVENLWNVLGIHKIGVIYQDDAFGQAVLSGLQLALKKHNAAPVGMGTFPRNTLDVEKGLNAVRPMNPGAVLIVGPYAPVAEIVKKAHATGWHPIFVTVSFVGTEKFITEAGKDAEGTVITQVVPPYTRTDFPTVALYREALNTYYPNEQPNFVSLEGFVDAMVLVEGLKRAGKDLTRDRLIAALESIQNKDVGLGPRLTLKYSATRHKGFDQIYTTVVRGGKPEILDDWKKLPH
ncbi:MAG TPA: ABC transporter substrate-binding protein [Candidatus Angelobacter sp.]|jgi:ABC-type branched-subunit amino acid transport system substrate-binding protein|nr:ABC transporter substrate-binding protein [Candidatus Angelobacter sp.]